MDHRLHREYGRAPRGERIYEAVPGKRRERTSIISASQHGKLVAPLVFQGSCNTEVVDAYFEQVLLPELPPGSVIVLDNARFHQSPTTQKSVHRYQPQPFYRQYVPMLLLIDIAHRRKKENWKLKLLLKAANVRRKKKVKIVLLLAN